MCLILRQSARKQRSITPPQQPCFRETKQQQCEHAEGAHRCRCRTPLEEFVTKTLAPLVRTYNQSCTIPSHQVPRIGFDSQVKPSR